MHLKRFRGATMRDALAQARKDFGADALVLSTRVVAPRGLRGWFAARQVEITVGREREMSEPRPPRQDARHVAPAPQGDDEIVARLVAAGVPQDLAADVASAVPRSRRRIAPADSVRDALAARLDSLASGAEPYAAIELFVGPAGDGKTTTIAKIVAQERARHDARLALVAADGFRVGAVEQLQIYADILGAPFRVARTPADLDVVLSTSRGPVLVDTAGRPPSDVASRELFEVIGRRDAVRTHLVVAADTTPAALGRILDRYQPARPQRVVITKIDEAESFTPLMSMLRERELPISYLAFGQQVPEDLTRATPALLAGCMLGDGLSVEGAA
jgi:flagellar biosynthesis protein FlhF